jgi:hypothetical protein
MAPTRGRIAPPGLMAASIRDPASRGKSRPHAALKNKVARPAKKRLR